MVEIRPLIKSDASRLAELANNKNIWDNLRDYIPYPYRIEDAHEFIKSKESERPTLTFGITHSSEFCGIIGLNANTDVHRLTAEMGYWVGEPFWKKGITTKAIALVSDYGFKKLGLERIYASVFDFNIPSMRVLEKNGFNKEGVLRNSVIKNGTIHDQHLYAKLKNE
ncbi:GNAT family N-acetyltransferase [Croceivirga thetidis]|nr:GNAT family protein [Croceivirga thetidis]